MKLGSLTPSSRGSPASSSASVAQFAPDSPPWITAALAIIRSHIRDPLTALQKIQSLLATGEYNAASNVAEKRLGMSALHSHAAYRLK
jgi:hypothetical protein